jgi:YYY domain-containing protein
MPFALLVVGLSLNLFFGGAQGKTRWVWINLGINRLTFISAALIIGGLAFLNTWDFPMYVVLFSLVYTGYSLITERQSARVGFEQSEMHSESIQQNNQDSSVFWLIKEFLSIAFSLSVTGVLFYIPFYIGFSSQAGGILPNLIYSTRGIHLWVMFGSLLLPIFAYILFIRSRNKDRFRMGRGFLIAVGLILGLWLLSLGFGVGIANIPLLGNIFMSTIGGGSSSELISESLTRRVNGLGWVTLLVLLTFTFGYLVRLIKPKMSQTNLANTNSTSDKSDTSDIFAGYKPSTHDFVFILVLMGGLLVIFVEFFFLRDQFGSRMNTIFKFYFQTWIFWGLAAAFGSAVLLKGLQGLWNILFRISFGLLLIASLTYPLLSLWNKTSGFNPPNGYTLDGTAYLERNTPDEMAGIRWLEAAPDGVIVEAVGPQYSEYARVATNSGQPNILGWAGHESQWRGGRKEIGTREEDIEMIFSTNDWESTKLLLDMYNARYIFIGPLERRTYRVNEAKFERFLGEPVFQSGQVAIFEVPMDS